MPNIEIYNGINKQLQGYFGKFEEGFSLIVAAHVKMHKVIDM
jgi:hypothetical protein